MRAICRVTVLLLVAWSAFAREGDPRVAAFRSFAESEMKAQQVHGLSVAVVHGDFRWSGGIGLADIENDVPATAKSSYRMASVTKPMTAVAVLKLAEEGKIDLDAEVQAYVPAFPRKSHPVTVRQLLAHQGGISHYRDYEKEGRIREPKSTKEAIEIFDDFDLVAEPGTAYRYTTYGYNLLGAVIEGASGRGYAEVMREKVWLPLGMHATRMDDPRAVIPNRVPGYVLENGSLRRSEYVDVSSRFAGGGTRSTVEDMVAFMEGLTAGKVLGRETLDRAWTAQATRDGRRTSYGLGFGSYSRNGRWVVGHSGAQQEARTLLVCVPSRRFVVALATNNEHVDLGPFEDELFELFLGDPVLVGLDFADPKDAQAWRAMREVYASGLAWYDRHGRAMTADRRELAAAFKYFREAAGGDAAKARDGSHPLAGEPFVKAGSYMASVLASRGELERYHGQGALSFFLDYARAAREHRFDGAFAKRLETWNEGWRRVRTPEIASLDPRSAEAIPLLEKNAEMLSTALVRPDFARELVEAAEASAMRGDFAAAAKRAAIGQRIYPRSAGLNGVLGVLTILGGETAKGTELLARSKELDREGYASPANLLSIARFLAGGPARPGAVALLEASLRVYPENAELRKQLELLKN